MARNRNNEDDDDTTDLSISSDDDQDDEGLEDDEDGDDEDDGSDLDDGDADEDDGDEDDQDDGEGDDDGEEEAGDDDEDDEDDLDPDDPDLAAIASEGDDPPASIPYARVVEMVEKARQEGAAGKTADTPPAEPEFDLKGKIAERNKAILDGDEEKATELDLEIEEYRTKEAERRVASQLQADRATAQLNKAVKHVMAKYPALNDQNGKYYDPEAVQDVRALRDTYIRERGMAPAAALLKAADRYFGKAAKTAKGEGEGEDGKGGKQPKETDRLRRLLKRARKAKAQPATPTGKRGSPNRGAAAIDFESLTEDDLTDDMIRRLERENPKLLARLQGDIA